MTTTLNHRYATLLQELQQLAPQNPPQLIAVSKTVTAAKIHELYQLGQRLFGENRYPDLLSKQQQLASTCPDIEWHYIGRVQTRQVKEFINQIAYLHSLDRLELAKEIQKRATQPVSCFLQVNISGESTKAGFEPDELLTVLEQLAHYDKIKVVGLMTMAPFDARDAEIHYFFQQLKALQEAVQALNLPHAPCTLTSMGMSQDYPIATKLGASYIRVGSLLFDETE